MSGNKSVTVCVENGGLGGYRDSELQQLKHNNLTQCTRRSA